MEFDIESKCFARAISAVSKGVALKSVLPILSGVKIIAETNRLILIGSNADLIVKKVIPEFVDGEKMLDVFQEGSAVLSAKFLENIIRKLPEKIHFKSNGYQSITLQSGEITTKLNGYDPEEYPKLPQMDQDKKVSLPSNELLDIINLTIFAVSKSETRPVLAGVNFIFDRNQLRCSSTNSHRLAMKEHAIDSNIKESIIVPSVSLHELTKLFKADGTIIDMYINQNQILFQSKTTSLYSRLIEGVYPDISNLIPDDSSTIISLDTEKLLKGMERACLFANEWRNNNIHMKLESPSEVRIYSDPSQVGAIEETQKIDTLKGEKDLQISFDASFMKDALNVIKEDMVSLSFGGSMRPILIRPKGDDSQLHLISPVRTY